ncbi:MAG TPA: UbiH/UbiF/VisC/COQ6 family ubiquinone biosynthesis hydroxylase [Pseudomonadales bacterium]|nr:UbiH/UbiF/VisC/COQ6 family ubiquinone biosynthesis hydroxylase [Pseudomonadales bacterium]
MSAADRIAVVGGGLVGAFTALTLARIGFEVDLIERARPAPATLPVGRLGADLRSVALAPASVAALRELGVWDATLEAGACGYTGMEVWDAEGTGVIHFDAADAGVPALGWIVENRALVLRLWELLEDSDVRCHVGAGVAGFHADGDGAHLELEGGARIDAALVVAADGGRSRIRELAGIGVSEDDTGQVAVATVVEVERSHEQIAWQRFLPTGPLAFLPLPDRDGAHRVSVVWSLEAEEATRVRALDDEAFAAALERAFEARLGAVVAVDARIAFPLVQQHAQRYTGHGVVLVGDAAHVLHPLAGQGVNLGMRDVLALADELRHIRRGPAAARLGEPDLLARYERARRGDNALMLGAMTGLRRLFGADDIGIRWLRNTGLRLVDGARPLKRQFMAHALGLG